MENSGNSGQPHGKILTFHVSATVIMKYLTHSRLMALFPGLSEASRYQKGKTNLDFTEARGSEWQWHEILEKQG